MIAEIGTQERAFNTLEANYAALASTWLLATFAGVGFILTNEPRLPVPTEVVILGLGLAGAVGITLVWVIDVLVYHTLLDAVWWAGLGAEIDHPEIPPVRTLMFELGPVTPRIKMFYLGLVAAPLAIAIFGAAWSAHLVASGSEPIAVILGLYLSTVWLLQIDHMTELNAQRVRDKFTALGIAARERYARLKEGWTPDSK
jgi:hypothetical protein